MKIKIPLLLTLLCLMAIATQAQLNLDTLAFQDFEITPATPTWTYTGTPNAFNSGYSAATNSPANSPIGIGGSRAWWLVQVGSGNPVTFNNQTIPTGYDSIRVQFRLAAMNLNGTGNGPDHLDYVLLEYSTNGGSSFSSRIRVRGASTNNCWWPYSATGVAKAYYLPATEIMFQPTSSGAQTTMGYSTVELVFPGSISQVSVRITPRSSASGDHWLIDNLLLTGENACNHTTSSFNASDCDSYLSPSGKTWDTPGTYIDTIPNATGCDSIITVNLNLTQSTTDTLSTTACNSYTSPSGKTWTTSGAFEDTIPNAANCDSLIYINLTLSSDQYDTIADTSCFSYNSPGGKVWTSSGTYHDTIPTTASCDSFFTINLVINQLDTSVTQIVDTLYATTTGASYQWFDCNNGLVPGATSQWFVPVASGMYAVIITQNSCTDTSNCHWWVMAGRSNADFSTLIKAWPNPAHDLLKLDLGTFRNATLSITDLQGRVRKTKSIRNTRSTSISLNELPTGIYLIGIRTETQSAHLRFIKE